MARNPHLRCIKPFGIAVARGLVLLMVAGFLAAATAGCQFAPKQALSLPWSKEQEKKQPSRILPVWTDTVLYQTNEPGVRGFGGRIYFYEEQQTEPIEVDGGLAVYVFDADNAEPHDQKPLRKFVFTNEQFSKHMSRTSIGPSYSVWLPWGEVGGPPLRLSLIARFEGAKGGTVISDPTIKLLPGVMESKQSSQNSGANSNTIQLASHAGPNPANAAVPNSGQNHDSTNHEGAPGAASIRPPRRPVGTIDLPPSFQRHLFLNEHPRTEAVEAEPHPSDTNSPPQPSNLPTSMLEADSSGGSQTPAAPLTTTVIDYRTRWQNSTSDPASYAGSRTKRDIRQGKWIESTR